MNVITNAPIYSGVDALTTYGEVKGKTPEEVKALKDAERARIKQEKLQDRAKLKEERDARLAQKKQERQARRADRKAKRNAKKLLRLRDKTGKEKILYPLTRLRRNKDNKLVKVYPDGKETIVKEENTVSITVTENTATGQVAKTETFDKAEVAAALNIPKESVTPQVLQEKKVEVDKKDAPIQANETKITGFENVVAVEVKPEDVVVDNSGNEVLTTETQDSATQEIDVVDENKLKNEEQPKGLSLGVKIAIGVGLTVVLAGIGYMIYRASKNN